MTAKQALAKLEKLGSAQTRKTYGRHGVAGEMYGVEYGDMTQLVREIKLDHSLALELWDSGNHVLSYQVAGIAAKSATGRKLMKKWMGARGEWPAATGWGALAQIASEPGAVNVDEARDYLATIEERIHGGKNRVKYSMNTTMIALGAYVPGFEDEAVRIAERIGQVEVDHGLTNCQTPLAGPYIRKAAAHHRAKLGKAARKKSAKKKPRT